MGPMASASPTSLAAAVANAGGMGGCGALNLQPAAIRAWTAQFRSQSNGGFQINLWIPDPTPHRDPVAEARVRDFLRQWGPEVAPEAGDASLPDFAGQCEAVIEAGPSAVSSIMGLYPDAVVARMKAKGIKWFATVTTVSEARAAVDAGADVLVASGMEAGGHRGAFDAARAEANLVGLFSLIPAVADAVSVPVVAAGGIADARTLAAALLLGASAVQIGTAFLRCPEANLPAVYADAIGRTLPEQTMITRAMSGRAARSIATPYVKAAAASDAPPPAPYPVQRGLTQAMRAATVKSGALDGMQAWAGQSAAMARTETAGEVVRRLWEGAQTLL